MRIVRYGLDGAQRPLMAKLDALGDHLDAVDRRLVELSRRIDDLERIAQTAGVRASTLAETVSHIVESNARAAQRAEEIERLLGGPPTGP
jgi:ABC-type transporter Mla subunit MlaD